MTAVRGAVPEDDSLTLQREAAMRRGIRQAAKDGFTNVAVVCGAWHATRAREAAVRRRGRSNAEGAAEAA